MFGYAKTNLLGENVKILMPSPHREQHDEYLQRYHSTDYSNIVGGTREMEAIRSDGTLFPIELTVAVVHEAEGKDTYTGSIREITDRKEKEDRIRYLALYDQLTGLPNRASFNENVDEVLSRARRNNSGVALMFIVLDKFKPINDTYGHEAGDIVLKSVASRLEEAIRNTDTAARLGDDEFVVILENIFERENMEIVTRKGGRQSGYNVSAKIPPLPMTGEVEKRGVFRGWGWIPVVYKTWVRGSRSFGAVLA